MATTAFLMRISFLPGEVYGAGLTSRGLAFAAVWYAAVLEGMPACGRRGRKRKDLDPVEL